MLMNVRIRVLCLPVIVMMLFLSVIAVNAYADTMPKPLLQNDLMISDLNNGGSFFDIAFDGNNYLVVYANSQGIIGQFVSRDGTLIGQKITIGPLYSHCPAIAYNGQNYLVVYENDVMPGGCGIQGRIISTSGSLSPIFVITSADNTQDSPDVIANEQGDYLVVWMDARHFDNKWHVYGQKVSSEGILSGNNFLIGSMDKSENYPYISSDGSNYLVVWYENANFNTGEYDLSCARVSSDGVVLDPQGIMICNAAGYQGFWGKGGLSFDGTNYIVTWKDTRNGDDSIYYGRISPAGILLDGIPQTYGKKLYSTYMTLHSRVEFDGSNWLAIWSGNGVQGSRIDTSGNIIDTSPVKLSKTTSTIFPVNLAFDGENYLVIWATGNYPYTIYGQIVQTRQTNTAPVAIPGGPYVANEGDMITFSAAGSYDNEGNALQYRWDFNGDGTWDTVLSTSTVATKTWDDEWIGNAIVEVNDGEFTSTASAPVTVNNAVPIINAGDDIIIDEGSSFTVYGSFIDPGSDLWSATVDYGDGSNIASLIITGKHFELNHVYEVPGIYTITITISDDDGGQSTDTIIATVKSVDNIPPVTSCLLDGLEGDNEWFRSGVIVTLSAEDNVNGVGIKSTEYSFDGNNWNIYTSPFSISDDGIITLYYRSIDDGDNVEEARSVVVKIDTAAPVISGEVGSLPNSNGWYKSDINIRFIANDVLSGISSVTPDKTLLSEGYGMSVSGTAVDNAGNIANIVISNINIDKTPPAISGATTVSPNEYGWYNSDVTVQFTANDALSGIEVVTPNKILSDEGGAQSATGMAIDLAGNVAEFTLTDINIDKTAPMISGASTMPPNSFGWYNTDVIIEFEASDVLSGIALMPSDITITGEGQDLSATGTVTDKAGNSATAVVCGINIDKSLPVIEQITAPIDPVKIGTAITVGATYIDTGVIYMATWDWGDGMTSSGVVNGNAISGTHVYTTPNVYIVTLTLTDMAGNTCSLKFSYIVVYDPDGGFITGGGWIDSPIGAYYADPSLTGKANFGFISKYQKGATVPTGNTEFQFKAANMNFKSTAYEWLVIAGAKAQYKGTGTINGAGNYKFILTAIDGQMTGDGGLDKFRIKIWDSTSDAIIYDNLMNAADDADPTTVLGGGSIVIHKK